MKTKKREAGLFIVIKGCKKKIIYLKNTDSSIFDEAYFILRRDSECGACGETDMVDEAKRIIEGAGGIGKRDKKRKNLWFFSLGAVCATAVLALGGILLSLL